MRIFILADLEGVCGVYRWDQTRDYDSRANLEARRLLMGEVNAAVDGAFLGGATRVVVEDGHLRGTNFFADDLDPRAEMAVGSYRPRDRVMAQGFDCAFLLGFHAMSHTPSAVLCHTHSSVLWNRYWINDRPAGEIAQMALLLGRLGVPIGMITGDEQTCDEGRQWLGEGLIGVAVKTGLGREGAIMLAPARARDRIREGAREAVSRAAGGALRPFTMEWPVTARWEFKDSAVVDTYRGSGRIIDGATIEKVIDDPNDLFAP